MMAGFWSPAVAPLVNLGAFLLALAFRRNRAALVVGVLVLVATVLDGFVTSAPALTSRLLEGIRIFAPWFLVMIVVMPEPRLLARRSLLLVLLITAAVWCTLSASASFWTMLESLLLLKWLTPHSDRVVAGVTLLAALVCAVRWIVRGIVLEAGLSLVILLVALALWPALKPVQAEIAIAGAGVLAMLAILYASYRMAFVDALSGLPNRRALDETLARLSGEFALAMVDVDHFKRFNDTHGHAAGDRVLAAVARQLVGTSGGRAFRYGGEEFCLLFTGRRVHTAAAACENTRERIAQQRVRIRSAPSSRRRTQAVRRVDASDVRVTVSIGLATRNSETRTTDEVMKAADQALYRAKDKGRNRVMER